MKFKTGNFAAFCVAVCAFAALAARATPATDSRDKRGLFDDRAAFAELWGRLGAELYAQDSSESNNES